MRIVICTSDNNKLSGAFLSMVKLVSILQEEYKHKCFVILPNKGEGEELLKSNGIPYIVIKSYHWTISLSDKNSVKNSIIINAKKLFNKISIYRIKRVLVNKKIDIVHVNSSWTYVGAAAAYSADIPVVWHIREFLEEDQGRKIWDKKFGYKLFCKASFVVAISQSIYRKYEGIVDKKNIRCIYNGIDPTQFYDSNHVPFLTPQIHFSIIGHLGPKKRQMDVVNACFELYRQGIRNIELDIVGDDQTEYAAKIKELVKTNDAEKYIHILGRTNNPERYYKKADIVFMCSESEAFGRVTVEAMLAGALIIGADSGATKELIDDGNTGLLYDSGDINMLVAKIIYAINNQEMMRVIANNGRNKMMQTMTANANANAINDLYKEVKKAL